MAEVSAGFFRIGAMRWWYLSLCSFLCLEFHSCNLYPKQALCPPQSERTPGCSCPVLNRKLTAVPLTMLAVCVCACMCVPMCVCVQLSTWMAHSGTEQEVLLKPGGSYHLIHCSGRPEPQQWGWHGKDFWANQSGSLGKTEDEINRTKETSPYGSIFR